MNLPSIPMLFALGQRGKMNSQPEPTNKVEIFPKVGGQQSINEESPDFILVGTSNDRLERAGRSLINSKSCREISVGGLVLSCMASFVKHTVSALRGS